jgi:predicted acyltransferase
LAKVGQFALWGAALIVLGLIWNLNHPIVKHIWTSSFVLFSGGLCFLLMGLFYLFIDVLQWKGWAFPFVVIGSNAIVAYMLGHLIDFRVIGDVFVRGLAQYTGAWQEIIRWAAHFAILYGILYYLYKHKIFLKI